MDLDRILYQAAIQIPIFLFALSVHEAAHAVTAKWGGDLTAAMRGRVTLNPLSHIDPVGTIFMPAVMLITGFPLIGWAKPVPSVDINFKKGQKYGVVVAMAGPFSNLLIALFAVVFLQFYWLLPLMDQTAGLLDYSGAVYGTIETFLIYTVFINLLLMIFNLIPVPPLDGSWLLYYFVVLDRPHLRELYSTLYQWGFMILLLLLWTGVIGFIIKTVIGPVSGLFFEFAQYPLRFL